MQTDSVSGTRGTEVTEQSGVAGRPMKKALILAYRFPPQGGGGVQRTLKFVKYLPAEGWLPVVQTVSNPLWPIEDRSLLAEVPPFVKVLRTRTFEFERLGRAADDLISGRGPRAADAGVPGPAHRGRGNPARRMLKAVAGLVQRHVLVPDPQIAWVPGAVLGSLATIRRERIALVYSSSPPNSCQVLGLLIKRLTGLPWVADLRD